MSVDISEEHLAENYCLLHAGFLFGFLFYPEDRGEISLPDVG
jgi:hypothetical protein